MSEEMLVMMLAAWFKAEVDSDRYDAPYVDADDLDSVVIDGRVSLRKLAADLTAAGYRQQGPPE